jgi:hypothetical protein
MSRVPYSSTVALLVPKCWPCAKHTLPPPKEMALGFIAAGICIAQEDSCISIAM